MAYLTGVPVASITQAITDGVVAHGVAGIVVLMAVDALLPVGGELIMVVAGAIAAGVLGSAPTLLGHPLPSGAPTYVVLSVAGIAGSMIGAWAGWLIGVRAGYDVIDRHGHLVHLGPARLAKARRWFARHGSSAVLLGRLTPLVRSFISIPSGLFGVALPRYSALSALASAIWCFGFAALGWALGTGYGSIDHATRLFEAALAGVVIAATAGLLVLRRRGARSAAE